ncbi:hypothetical protein NBC122_00477 [Chryseobacterium salivictor]|uniref:Uncharacterized protein n=2 Tax=Chryseobacterium salivictor TaxID=2547600 RepID=A0A4P6ZCS9_9FLAO|nr:hypothetical protein NBC122_00477 [Chryseobacterium salivictor]
MLYHGFIQVFLLYIYIPLRPVCYRIIMVKGLILMLLFNLGTLSEHFRSTKSGEDLLHTQLEKRQGGDSYLWTSFFNQKSNAYLMALLKEWNIKTLFLSVNPTMDLAKLRSFKILASQNGIKVDFLIGENSYLEEDDGFTHLEKVMIEGRDLGFAGIHLDIEPHTFDDYHENIKVYSKRQIKLYTQAKKWCAENGMDLSTSVPMHLPIEVAKNLSRNNITTYIMAYDHLSLEKKMDKTEAIRKILKNNYRWVFEIDDFPDYTSLQETENKLIEKGIKGLAYHDLSQMNLFKK